MTFNPRIRRPIASPVTVRLAAALGALVLVACHPAAGSGPEPVGCGPNVPETAQHPIAMRATSLAGDYQLIQMQTQPRSGVVISGRLLTPLDSAAREAAVGGPVRDLDGRLHLDNGSQGQVEAALAGQHLRLGPAGFTDSSVGHLTITAVAPEGFRGWWRSDRGIAVTTAQGGRLIPDPAGYFCALRRDSAPLTRSGW
jgi:hypothetical protein